MGMAAARAPAGGWSPYSITPLKILVKGLSLLSNCYLENNFHKKIKVRTQILYKNAKCIVVAQRQNIKLISTAIEKQHFL